MRSSQIKCIFLIFFITFGLSCAAVANNEIFPEKSSMKAKCESSYNLQCLKLDLISLIDRFSATNAEYQLTSGITLVRDSSVNKTQNAKIVSELARAFPDSAEKRLNGFLVAKIQEFLQSFTLRLKLLNEDVASEVESARKDGYGGGGGDGFGKKGGYGMLGMAMMMKGMMGAMAMGGVAALAGKALLTGMMALTLASIVALKALTSKSDKKTTYEIISKPVYSHSHSYSASGGGHGGHGHSHEDQYGGGGYGRSFQEFKLPESVKA